MYAKYFYKYFLSFGNNLALSSRQHLSLQSWLNRSNGINLIKEHTKINI